MNASQVQDNHKYRGRFAPSPTGPLHLGSLYTALASFLQARWRQGEWLLRVDDADSPRVAPGADGGILRTLEKFGLHWDGPVVYQSHESEAYHAALEQLDFDGWLYPCLCSRKSLSTLPHEASGRTRYPGICRGARHGRQHPHALRVITKAAAIHLDDLLQGSSDWNLEQEFGDFIVYRRDRIIAYHLATVIDDFRSGITEVLRGFDLLESTPLQIYLQQLLGLPTPHYLHIPIIVNREGIKLSKQNLAQPVDARQPSPLLSILLQLLRQNPPQELGNAPVDEILRWAIQAWDVSLMSGTSVNEPPKPTGNTG